MSAAQERRTLARLSVAAGSAMTLAAAWLGVLRVDTPAVAPDGADPSLALAQEAILAAAATDETTPAGLLPAAPTPTPTAATGTPAAAAVAPATATPRAVVTPAVTPAAPAGTVPVPTAPAVVTATAPAATPTVRPATTPAPAPTPRIVTRRSRAS
ncbi:MAG: hypothetical protein AB7G21_04380 [Dehalococcoidia bacterium]